MGWSLLIGGVIMWIVDAMHAKAEAAGPNGDSKIRTWNMEDMSLVSRSGSVSARFFSAVFPGTSRRCPRSPPDDWRACRAPRHWSSPSFVSIPTMAAATLYTLLSPSAAKAKIRLASRRLTPMLDRAGHRLHRLVHRGLWRRRLVYGVGPQAGIYPFAVYRIIIGILVLAFAARLA